MDAESRSLPILTKLRIPKSNIRQTGSSAKVRRQRAQPDLRLGPPSHVTKWESMWESQNNEVGLEAAIL